MRNNVITYKNQPLLKDCGNKLSTKIGPPSQCSSLKNHISATVHETLTCKLSQIPPYLELTIVVATVKQYLLANINFSGDCGDIYVCKYTHTEHDMVMYICPERAKIRKKSPSSYSSSHVCSELSSYRENRTNTDPNWKVQDASYVLILSDMLQKLLGKIYISVAFKMLVIISRVASLHFKLT